MKDWTGMALQLRVRHSLGARMIEVEGRSADRPITVGSAGDADIQIPSSAVAPTHCLLYQEDGQWVLRNEPRAGGTYINGARVKGSSYVKYGDKIVLGAGAAAAVIEVDPLGTARRSSPAASRPAAPTAEQYSSLDAATDAPPPPPAVIYPAEQAAPVEEQQAAEESFWPTGGETAMGWPTQPARRAYRRRRKSNSGTWTAVGVMLAMMVVAMGILAAIAFKNREPAAIPAPPPVAKKPAARPTQIEVEPTKIRKTIFDDPDPSPRMGAPRPTQPQPSAPVAPPTQPRPDPAAGNAPAQPAQMQPAADPLKQTDEWKAVERANNSLNYARAIWTNEDYRQRHPGELDSDLTKMTDEALDSLWWERVRQLCQSRDQLRDEIRKLDDDIRAETEPDYKKKLEKTKESKGLILESVRSALADEMAYRSDEVPEEYNSAQIARLRKERDTGRFEAWSKAVVKYIRSHNGELPWQHR